jgi:ferredoxin
MSKNHYIKINYRQAETEHIVEASQDKYILHSAEEQGVKLPFACRNGACTTCAVRVLKGRVYQPEAMGLSAELKRKGYALLCVCYPLSDVEVETQDEDEVYELQFGRYFGRGKVRFGLPLDEE